MLMLLHVPLSLGDVLHLSDIKIVVLDEVDSLLKMGFEEQVLRIRSLTYVLADAVEWC